MSEEVLEGLYLIHPYCNKLEQTTIYKIGRSDNLLKRIDNYPNGSSVELLIKCSNSKIYEDNLIELFEIVFKRESYFGTKYFSGDLETMKKLMLCHLNQQHIRYEYINKSILIESYDRINNCRIPKNKRQLNIECKKFTVSFNRPIGVLTPMVNNLFLAYPFGEHTQKRTCEFLVWSVKGYDNSNVINNIVN
jgi:hypothetical protein